MIHPIILNICLSIFGFGILQLIMPFIAYELGKWGVIIYETFVILVLGCLFYNLLGG